MSLLISLLAISVLLGGVLWVWGEMREARHLRLATLLLSPENGAGEALLDPMIVPTVLERTRMILGATKLSRLAGILLLLPPAILLMILQLHPGDGERAPQWVNAPLAVEALTFLLILIVTLIARRIIAWNAASGGGEGGEAEPPGWLLDEEEDPPAVIVAAGYLWEKTMDLLERGFRSTELARPHAQLYEQDDHVRLTISSDGEVEEAETPPQTHPEAEEKLHTEAEMIRAIQRLDTTLVRELMKPINAVTAFRLRDFSLNRFLALCRRTGYTRIPVYEDHVTNLIGYVNTYDLLKADKMPKSLRPYITQPLFVPEVAPVDLILQEMITKKQQVAVVFDEFGGTSGWLTREDILEEIVGEVEDEYDRPERKIQRANREFLVDPGTDLDDLFDELGLELPKRNCDTIAGYIYQRLGRVPRRGEKLEEKGWQIRVTGIDGHRIRRLRLTPPLEEQRNGVPPKN